MTQHDSDAFTTLLQEVCAVYDRAFSDVLSSGYYRALKSHSLEAVNKAILRILTDDQRRQVMPTAAEIKAMAKFLENKGAEGNYLPCQATACGALLTWPPAGLVTEHSYYCPRHKPAFQPGWSDQTHRQHRLTPEEKQQIASMLTPSALAFLRSAVPHLVAEIGITAAEVCARMATRGRRAPQEDRHD